jgi:hypothetical protein
LYCLSFGHCIVCLLAIVLSVFLPLYCLYFEILLLITLLFFFLQLLFTRISIRATLLCSLWSSIKDKSH